MQGPASGHRVPTSPLDRVVRGHGATMAIRHGRCVAAHFGSAASEAAVCLRTVGIADRSDRTTFELRGAPADIDAALATLDGRVWFARTSSRSAVVRCEEGDSSRCAAALSPGRGTLAVGVSDRYAAIGVIGPRAAQLLRAAGFDDHEGQPIVLHDAQDSFEVLVDEDGGPRLWAHLLKVGAQFRVACVGLDALERLAASNRVGRLA